ncbi:MAG: hypothetical protein RLZZ126_378 [Pseudomonadota bacterium]
MKRAATSPWTVAWAAFGLAVAGWGLGFYGPAVFIKTLHTRDGWAISALSAAVSFHFLFSSVLIFCLPGIHARLGVARATALGLGLAAAGALAWGHVTVLWQIWPAAALSASGWALTSGVALNAILSQHFAADRPKALSLAYNGASMAGLLVVPLWVALIAWRGLPLASIVMAVAALGVMLPLALRWFGPPAGQPTAAGAATAPTVNVLRLRRFWMLSLPFALGLFAQVGVLTHLLVYMSPLVGAALATSSITALTLFAILGRTLFARYFTGFDLAAVAGCTLSVQAAGFALMAWGGVGQPRAEVLLVGAALFGLGFGNLTSLPPMVAQRWFAPSLVGTVVARVTGINQALYAFAPAVFGLMRDHTGSYLWPLLMAAVLQILAAGLLLQAKKRVSAEENTIN